MGAESPPLFVASLVGRRVAMLDGPRLGRVGDVVVGLDGPHPPAVRGLLVRARGLDLFVAISHVSHLGATHMEVGAGRVPPGEFHRRGGELLAYREIVDRQVVDVRAARVMRVNDAAVARRDGGWRLIGVDVSAAGLLRRLAPRTLHRRLVGSLVEWAAIELLATEMAETDLPVPHPGLAALHPADVGRVIDHLPSRHGVELMSSLDDATAADVMEEVEPPRQVSILDQLPRERAARILDRMAPDAAADVLDDLPPPDANDLIARMEDEAAAKVRLLLTYEEDSAGGLMTTEFVVALERDTTRQAVDYVRTQLHKPDLVYYVYVVDDPDNQRLRGVVSLRDLLLAAPDAPLPSYMRRHVRSVRPEQPGVEAARVMREYNLLALPVVDARGRMLGLITADDVLDVLLPHSLRRHVPRLFS